jgi:hypothetical protein
VLLSYVGEVDNYTLVNNLKPFYLKRKSDIPCDIHEKKVIIFTKIKLNLLEKIHEWVLGGIRSLIC